MQLTIHNEVRAQLDLTISHLNSFNAVTSDADVESIATLIKQAKKLSNGISDFRRKLTATLDEQKKSLIAQEKALTAPLDDAANHARRLSDEYLAERRRIAEEAKRKAAEAAAKAQAEAEATAKAEAAFGIVRPASVAEPATPESALSRKEIESLSKLSNVSTRTTWDFEVTDIALLPRKFFQPSPTLIKDELATLKKLGKAISDINIPGLKVFEKVSTIIR